MNLDNALFIRVDKSFVRGLVLGSGLLLSTWGKKMNK